MRTSSLNPNTPSSSRVQANANINANTDANKNQTTNSTILHSYSYWNGFDKRRLRVSSSFSHSVPHLFQMEDGARRSMMGSRSELLSYYHEDAKTMYEVFQRGLHITGEGHFSPTLHTCDPDLCKSCEITRCLILQYSRFWVQQNIVWPSRKRSACNMNFHL